MEVQLVRRRVRVRVHQQHRRTPLTSRGRSSTVCKVSNNLVTGGHVGECPYRSEGCAVVANPEPVNGLARVELNSSTFSFELWEFVGQYKRGVSARPKCDLSRVRGDCISGIID